MSKSRKNPDLLHAAYGLNPTLGCERVVLIRVRRDFMFVGWIAALPICLVQSCVFYVFSSSTRFLKLPKSRRRKVQPRAYVYRVLATTPQAIFQPDKAPKLMQSL